MMLRNTAKVCAPLVELDPNVARKKARAQEEDPNPFGFGAKEFFEHVDDYGTTQEDLDAWEDFDFDLPFGELYEMGFP